MARPPQSEVEGRTALFRSPLAATELSSPAVERIASAGTAQALPGHAAQGAGAVAASGRRVLVLAPVGRDAALAVEALAAAGIQAEAVDGAPDLVEAVSAEVRDTGAPALGALLVTDDALGVDWSGRLVDVLERQPPWSDLPIVLLAGPLTGSEAGVSAAQAGLVGSRLMSRGSVTVLDRPVRVAALVSAVSAALRARARQVESHDLMEARTRALAEAERANRAKSAFLALMSHELRTPLNAVGGYVQLIEEGIYGPVTPEQHEALGRVIRAQEHLLAIINDLLDFARLEGGRLEYHIESVALADVVSEVVTMVESQLTARHLACETRLPAEPIFVSADREKLRQILLNLLSNATKFTPAGGCIIIEVADDGDVASATDLVRLHVQDTGIGIPADQLEAVFEPFVQAHRDRFLESQQGTGLGLPISRQLAQAMGGELTVASESGRGSTFTVALQRARA